MNIYAFIAGRISRPQEKTFSSVVIKIAILSIALSLAVILIAFGVLRGFTQEIQAKIFSFSGHLQVSQYNNNQSYEQPPISLETNLYKNYANLNEVKHLQVFAYKAGILKTKDEVMGAVLKGVSLDFDKRSFVKNLREGRFPEFQKEGYSREIMVSKIIAKKLKLQLGDTITMFFIQDPPKARPLTIVGIYESGMEDFDTQIIMGDIALIQKLNRWKDYQVGGYEIFVKDFERLQEAYVEVYDAMEHNMQIIRVTDQYIELFDWLLLLVNNVVIFLVLILAVACFNMVSILLIMIMERVRMIGLLKAIGATNWQIRKIFLIQGLRLLVLGLFWGNFIGLGFCALQYYFKIIPLDAENYFMYYVPIAWDWNIILLMNLLVFVLITLVLFLPTWIISNIRPVKALRFD